jgi:hypothetical protein
MLLGGVLGLVCFGSDQLKLNLQRRVTEQTRKLGFCFDFLGHQIEQKNAKRTDILRNRTRLGHDKDIFVIKYLNGGEIVRNFNGHSDSCPLLSN